jgi:hypothetical protein
MAGLEPARAFWEPELVRAIAPARLGFLPRARVIFCTTRKLDHPRTGESRKVVAPFCRARFEKSADDADFADW